MAEQKLMVEQLEFCIHRHLPIIHKFGISFLEGGKSTATQGLLAPISLAKRSVLEVFQA